MNTPKDNQAKQKEPTQRQLDDFVSREVYICQTSLVEELLNLDDPLVSISWDDIVNSTFKACDKCGGDLIKDTEAHNSPYTCDMCEDKVAADQADNRLEPAEIFEWWIVSDWLADKLEVHGEPILKSDYGTWWGRTCSGQAISMDSVIEDIYKELNAVSWI